MITVTYDPINGAAVPDGAAWDYALEFASDPRDVVISTEGMLYAIRVAAKRGLIDHSTIQVQFGKKLAAVGVDGGLNFWPVYTPYERFMDELCFDDEKDHADFKEFDFEH